MEVPEMEFLVLLAFDENLYRWGQTYGATVVPGGENGNTRSKDVNDGTVVGESSEAVRAVGSTDGVDSSFRCRRGVASIPSVVTGSNSHEDTSGDSVGCGSIDSSGTRTTKRHVSDSTVGAAASFGIVGDEVDASNDTGVGTLRIVSKVNRLR
jgi:hypothetical protein